MLQLWIRTLAAPIEYHHRSAGYVEGFERRFGPGNPSALATGGKGVPSMSVNQTLDSPENWREEGSLAIVNKFEIILSSY